jgi:hypothetical protein
LKKLLLFIFLLLPIYGSAQTVHVFCALDENCNWTGIDNFFNLENTLYADQQVGVNAGAKMNAALSSLSGGGIVDATALIPANTLLRLGPNVTFTCNVASAPCFKLVGPGSRLIGTIEGITIGTSNPANQSGTIVRAGTVSSTTDLIAINPSPPAAAGNGGYEVGNMILDFANPSSNTGRYCIAGYAFSHSWIHDVDCFNPGVNGMEFENAASGWSYDDRLDNIFVQAAGNNGFNWTTVPGSGGSDFDRWYCDRCKYGPTSSDGTFHGVNSFSLTVFYKPANLWYWSRR